MKYEMIFIFCTLFLYFNDLILYTVQINKYNVYVCVYQVHIVYTTHTYIHDDEMNVYHTHTNSCAIFEFWRKDC